MSIGGALYGYLASRQLTHGRDWSLGFVNVLESMLSPFKRKEPKLRVEKRFSRAAVRTDESFTLAKKNKQAKVDAILDKISRSGYDSLSKDEKDILFKASDGK